MHEALITRGMVSGHEHQEKIMSRYNCVLRHHSCPDGKRGHTPGIGSEEEYLLCRNNLIRWEGQAKVEDWLKEMIEYFPVAASEAYIRFRQGE